YVDPLSLLLDLEVRALEQDGLARVTRLPWELRAPPAPVLRPEDPLWARRWEDAQRLARTRGLTLRAPTLVPWSRKAHELAQHAREKGRFREVHEALFAAFLQEGRDIGRIDVLVQVAGEAGLDRTEAKAVLDVDRHTAVLDGLRGEAERLGIRGVPTILVA